MPVSKHRKKKKRKVPGKGRTRITNYSIHSELLKPSAGEIYHMGKDLLYQLPNFYYYKRKKMSYLNNKDVILDSSVFEISIDQENNKFKVKYKGGNNYIYGFSLNDLLYKNTDDIKNHTTYILSTTLIKKFQEIVRRITKTASLPSALCSNTEEGYDYLNTYPNCYDETHLCTSLCMSFKVMSRMKNPNGDKYAKIRFDCLDLNYVVRDQSVKKVSVYNCVFDTTNQYQFAKF